ncbi:hypothetical protein EDD85DRAFT_946767 [Armillaria nabsnona]|nr:hypothetical protein EDD85DRAFT_946767 [Armillaria nabsnona]
MFRSAFHRPLQNLRVRWISTSPVARNATAFGTGAPANKNASGAMKEASKFLDSVAAESPAPIRIEGGPSQDTLSVRPFASTSIIRPYEFTLKSRQNHFSPFKKPPRVGPPRDEARQRDYFHQLNLNPVDYACHPGVLNHFMSPMGKINSRSITSLTRKSQRRLGKAIRRSKKMGIMPTFSLRRQQGAIPSTYAGAM